MSDRADRIGAAGTRIERRWNTPMLVAAALTLFSFVSVNYWIYTARWWFLDVAGDRWPEPPTISRAISLPEIASPFSVWVTVAGICLVVSVAILARHYYALRAHIEAPGWGLWLALWIGIPAALGLQAVSAWGMNILSVHTLATDYKQHMVGSYAFFGAQAVVILIYAVFQLALVRDRANLARVAELGLLNPRWVVWRMRLSMLSVGLTVLYGALFKLKDVFPYDETPWVHLAYVTTEPLVITSFLTVVLLTFTDKLRLPVGLRQ